MKKYLFILSIFLSTTIFCQEIKIAETDTNFIFDNKNFPDFKNFSSEIDFQKEFRFNNSDDNTLFYNNQNIDFNLQKTINLDLPIVPIELEPLHVFSINDINFNLYNQYRINDYSWFSTTRSQQEYIGLGGVGLASGKYNVAVGERFIISGGLYAGKYTLHNSFTNDIGATGNMAFQLSERIRLHAFGNYSFNNEPTPYTGMYPQTSYGGAVELKVTDKWGIMMGAEREFDVFRGKWVTRPIVYPVFY